MVLEVVINCMFKWIVFMVGILFVIGVVFFVLYYYLKVVKKVDIFEWLLLFMLFFIFGLVGVGIMYGVLLVSWDFK